MNIAGEMISKESYLFRPQVPLTMNKAGNAFRHSMSASRRQAGRQPGKGTNWRPQIAGKRVTDATGKHAAATRIARNSGCVGDPSVRRCNYSTTNPQDVNVLVGDRIVFDLGEDRPMLDSSPNILLNNRLYSPFSGVFYLLDSGRRLALSTLARVRDNGSKLEAYWVHGVSGAFQLIVSRLATINVLTDKLLANSPSACDLNLNAKDPLTLGTVNILRQSAGQPVELNGLAVGAKTYSRGLLVNDQTGLEPLYELLEDGADDNLLVIIEGANGGALSLTRPLKVDGRLVAMVGLAGDANASGSGSGELEGSGALDEPVKAQPVMLNVGTVAFPALNITGQGELLTENFHMMASEVSQKASASGEGSGQNAQQALINVGRDASIHLRDVSVDGLPEQVPLTQGNRSAITIENTRVQSRVQTSVDLGPVGTVCDATVECSNNTCIAGRITDTQGKDCRLSAEPDGNTPIIVPCNPLPLPSSTATAISAMPSMALPETAITPIPTLTPTLIATESASATPSITPAMVAVASPALIGTAVGLAFLFLVLVPFGFVITELGFYCKGQKTCTQRAVNSCRRHYRQRGRRRQQANRRLAARVGQQAPRRQPPAIPLDDIPYIPRDFDWGE